MNMHFRLKLPPISNSQQVNFKKFLGGGGGHAPRPPRKGMLCTLTAKRSTLFAPPLYPKCPPPPC